jgi:hypothetical protein
VTSDSNTDHRPLRRTLRRSVLYSSRPHPLIPLQKRGTVLYTDPNFITATSTLVLYSALSKSPTNCGNVEKRGLCPDCLYSPLSTTPIIIRIFEKRGLFLDGLFQMEKVGMRPVAQRFRKLRLIN